MPLRCAPIGYIQLIYKEDDMETNNGDLKVWPAVVQLHGSTVSPTRYSPAEFQVLAGSTGAGGMAPPASTMISARMKRVQG